MNEAILLMAIRAQNEPEAIPVLGDMIVEAALDEGPLRTFAMALLVGVPLDLREPPAKLRTREAQTRWRRRCKRSVEDVAHAHWPAYAASCSPAWARAILAVLLFGDWSPATTATPGHYLLRTRSPWALVRAPAYRHFYALRKGKPDEAFREIAHLIWDSRPSSPRQGDEPEKGNGT